MRWAILAAAAIAVVNGVGCGGSNHPRVDPEAMLDAAAAHPITSANSEVDVRLQVEGASQLSGPIRLRLDGPYRSGGATRIPSFDWRLSASALGFPVDGRAVSTGHNAYLSVYGNQYEVGEAEVAEANRRIAEAGGIHLDLRRWLGPARFAGEDSEGGVDCERISAPLRGEAVRRDLSVLGAAIGVPMPAVSGRAIACVGFDDRTLHGLELTASLEAPGEAAVTRVRVHGDVVLSDVGEPLTIETPGGRPRPIRDLFLTLQDFGLTIPLG